MKVFITLLGLLVCLGARVYSQSSLVLTPWYSSTYADFPAYSGAADYRLVMLTSKGVPTMNVKYAGLNYTQPNAIPELEIQAQNLTPGVSVSCYLQAMSALGEVPEYNLMDMNYHALNPPPSGVTPHYGSNMGPTADGMMSTNGQGAWNSAPKVLAQWTASGWSTSGSPIPILLTCLTKISKDTGSTQIWADDFASRITLAAPVVTNPDIPNAIISATDGTNKTFDFLLQGLSLKYTTIFQQDRHLMWVGMDMGDGTNSDPLHVSHGYIGLQPNKTFTLDTVHCLKAIWSVDTAGFDGRKNAELLIQPALDPPQNFACLDSAPAGIFNTSNHFLMCRIQSNGYQLTAGAGFAGDVLSPSFTNIAGSAGQAAYYTWRSSNGRTRDDQSNLVLWVSPTQVALYEDGVARLTHVVNGVNIPWVDYAGANVSWLTSSTGIRIEFAGIIYHLALCQQDLQTYFPKATYDINQLAGFPGSDERHMNLVDVQVEPIANFPQN